MRYKSIKEGIPMGKKSINTPSKKQYSMGFELEMYINLEELYGDVNFDDISNDEFFNDIEDRFRKILPNCNATDDDSLSFGDDDNDRGVEIISPPYNTVEEGLEHLEKAFDFMNNRYIYTTDQCGLHVTFGKWTHEEYINIDWLKFFMVLHGEKALKDFAREDNEFATLQEIHSTISKNTEDYNSSNYQEVINRINSNLMIWADKFDIVNLKKLHDSGLLEFRAMGNEDYQYSFGLIKEHILRFKRALDIASDPNAYRKEYLTKISRYINVDKNNEDRNLNDLGRIFQVPRHLTISKNTLMDKILDSLFDILYESDSDYLLKTINEKLTQNKILFIKEYIKNNPSSRNQIRKFKNEYNGISTISGLNIDDYRNIKIFLKICFG